MIKISFAPCTCGNDYFIKKKYRGADSNICRVLICEACHRIRVSKEDDKNMKRYDWRST